MNKLLTIFFLCRIPFVSLAQYDHLLNDPNVIWAAETTLDFVPEPEYATPDSVEQFLRYSVPLKLINDQKPPRSTWGVMLNSRLQRFVFGQMAKGRCYATPDDDQPLSERECVDILDAKYTIITYNPETFESQTVLVYNLDPFHQVCRVRARQLLYFDQKDGDFKIFTAAIAPVLIRDFGYKSVPYVPFWVKMNDKADSKTLLADPNINWARRMFPLNPPDPATLKPLKDFKRPILLQWLERVQHDLSYDIWDTGYSDALVDAEARKKMFSCVDTVATFDPETYTEITKFVCAELKAEDIVHLILAQDWYWNERKKQFFIQLHAFAPVRPNKDEYEEIRFYQPLFWRKIKNKR